MQVAINDVLFQKALPVLKQIESHGYEAYFVGGCVRDTLLHKKINDIDIASSARPEEIESIFKTTFDVGKEHGTIVVLLEGEPYEVTTFRTEEGYSDFRRPDEVNFVRNLEEDTLRRDFTINAMAISGEGILYDYHGGLEDLSNEIIRCVGVPIERFEEDALRMMRAIRFASQLGFAIDEASFKAIIELKENLKYISIERIRIEFSKFLLGDFFTDKYALLVQSQLADYLPGFTNELASIVMKKVSEDFKVIEAGQRDERLMWAKMLMHMNEVKTFNIRSLLRKWTHSNAFINDVIEIIDILKLFQDKKINSINVYHHNLQLLLLVEDYLRKHKIIDQGVVMAIYQQLPIKKRNEMAVDGRQMIQLLELDKGGPIVGEWIESIERLIIEKEIENNFESIQAYIQNHRK